ncbi:uncharacterized protein WM294_001184 [Sarcoramphus papa]
MDAMTLLSQLGELQTETLYVPKAIKCVNVYEVACTLTQDGSEVDGPQLASGWKLSTLETSHLRLKGHCKFMYSDNNQLYHWAYVFPPLAGCAALPAPAAASGGRRASGAGCPRLPASRERRPGSAGPPRLSPAPLVRPAGRRPVLAHAQTARGCRGAGSHLRRPAGTSQAWPSSRRRRLPSAELQMRQVTKMHDHFHDLPGLNHKTACGTPLSVGLPATSRKGRSRPSSVTLDLLKKS